ncbi:hypothetical protein GCM10011391_23970 [Pullulanibacillus camelliae]|uniref:YhzD-like protein n=1 Tax=Pullulanibacillus camelliae TaxID=1707096 RepID=A0A8J2YI12_9BACL|nr:YhzD family protein [Pullulanibacillus camelliae]GGE44394.1 hypothetical protein GCM10011391_23970 [Pullulanibacillus camelliae]
MPSYTLTVFEKDGQKLLEETFEAADDSAAREQGEARINTLDYSHLPSRVVSPIGKLVHFHR